MRKPDAGAEQDFVSSKDFARAKNLNIAFLLQIIVTIATPAAMHLCNSARPLLLFIDRGCQAHKPNVQPCKKRDFTANQMQAKWAILAATAEAMMTCWEEDQIEAWQHTAHKASPVPIDSPLGGQVHGAAEPQWFAWQS